MSTKRATRKRAPQPPELKQLTLTDPRLTALLLFIDGRSPGDDEGFSEAMYASALADADAMLTSRPLTDAFCGALGRPELKDLITRAVHLQTRREDVRGPAELVADLMPDSFGRSELGADDSVTGPRNDFRVVLWEYCDQAMLRGACLMYRLLTGQPR
jgi:hypothetical protein